LGLVPSSPPIIKPLYSQLGTSLLALLGTLSPCFRVLDHFIPLSLTLVFFSLSMSFTHVPFAVGFLTLRSLSPYDSSSAPLKARLFVRPCPILEPAYFQFCSKPLSFKFRGFRSIRLSQSERPSPAPFCSCAASQGAFGDPPPNGLLFFLFFQRSPGPSVFSKAYFGRMNSRPQPISGSLSTSAYRYFLSKSGVCSPKVLRLRGNSCSLPPVRC